MNRLFPFGPIILIGIGILTQLAYLVLWPLSYRLTHGVDFSYYYLIRHEFLWQPLSSLLARWEALLPGIDHSLELNLRVLLTTFTVLFILYVAAAIVVYRSRPSTGLAATIISLALLFQASLFLMPGVFTTDVFSYVMYGQIAAVYQLNPYLHVPGEFVRNPVVHWIHPVWHFAPSVYGPAWVNLSWLLTTLTGHLPPVDQAIAYRGLINLVHLANVALAWTIIRTLLPRREQMTALLLFAWNPLLLFEFAGNAHNDALMVTFLLMAVVLFHRRQPLAGLVPLALSALVKYTSGLVAVPYLVLWLRQHNSRRWQAWTLARAVGVSGLVGLAVYAPWLEGPHIFGPMLDWARGTLYANHPPYAVASYLAAWLAWSSPMTTAAAESFMLDATRLLTRLAFVGYLFYEARRLRTPEDLLPSAVRILLVFLLVVHTWVLSWYFSWPVALAILIGVRSPLTHVAIGFSYTALISMYHYQYMGGHMDLSMMLVYLAPLIALALPLARRRVAEVATAPSAAFLHGPLTAPHQEQHHSTR